jgi:RimJ/RimL family protein N-acetyltransferase
MNENLATTRLLLRKYTAADREIVADFFTDETVAKYMANGPSDSREDAFELFDAFFTVYENTSGLHYEIWGIEFEGELIGHLELKKSKVTLLNELEVVYLLNPPFWNRGLMTEALLKVREHARSHQKILIAQVKSKNEASLSVLDKIGVLDIYHHDEAKDILKVTLLP